MQLAVRPLTAPPEHKISLAASGPAAASQSKKGALYSIAGIHNFANNEHTSQQLFALARDGFMLRGAAAAAASASSSALPQRLNASQSLAQLPLQSQTQSHAQLTHLASEFGAQRSNDTAAVSAAEGESSRAFGVGLGTQLRSAAATSAYYSSEPSAAGVSGMHVAQRPSYPTPFQSMVSRPATAMSQSQSHSATSLPSRTALPRPLSALSLASRSKTERLQQHGVRAASAMASPTARVAAGQTTTTQAPAAFRQHRSDDDEIARPHTSLGRAHTTQNAPTSNQLLAF